MAGREQGVGETGDRSEKVKGLGGRQRSGVRADPSGHTVDQK